MHKKSISIDPAKVALWRSRFEQREAGKLTVQEYCEQNSIGVKAFYYWKRRLNTIAPRSSPRPSSEYSEEERRSFVEQWKKSGLSQSEFCQVNGGLTQSQLSEWKNRLERQQSLKPQSTGPKKTPKLQHSNNSKNAVPQKSENQSNADSVQFVEIASRRNSQSILHNSNSRVIAEILISGGWQIKVLAGADTASLKNLLRAVVEY